MYHFRFLNIAKVLGFSYHENLAESRGPLRLRKEILRTQSQQSTPKGEFG